MESFIGLALWAWDAHGTPSLPSHLGRTTDHGPVGRAARCVRSEATSLASAPPARDDALAVPADAPGADGHVRDLRRLGGRRAGGTARRPLRARDDPRHASPRDGPLGRVGERAARTD